jgi:hypothetical protein
LKKN